MDKKSKRRGNISYPNLVGKVQDPADHSANTMPQATVPMWGNQLSPSASLDPNNDLIP